MCHLTIEQPPQSSAGIHRWGESDFPRFVPSSFQMRVFPAFNAVKGISLHRDQCQSCL